MDPEITILSEVSQEDKYHSITYMWHQNMTQVEITILSEVNQEDKYHGITYMWNQNTTQMTLSKEQKQTHSENTPAAATGERGAGVWGQQRTTATYWTDNQG